MIRPATPADAQHLADLAAATPGAPTWTIGQYCGMLTLSPSTHVVWVATLNESITGFAAFSVHPPEAELESITVHPAHQGRGHGRALLSAALQHLASSGITHVHLEVRSSSRAQALYRALGFVPTGHRPRYYSNPVEDAVLMQWTLPANHPTSQPLSGIIKVDYGS